MQHSTAEVEEELMQLWSSVEKDREAAAAQRAQHAERQRRRQEQRETRVAPLADAPTGAAAGEGERARVRWQRLQVAEDEEGEQEGEQREAAAVEAGAAGVERCMQTAAAAAAAAGESAAEGHAESGRPSEQRSLLPGGGGSDAAEQRQRGGSPLPAPPALPRIRTAERSLAELQGEEVLLAEATGNGSSSAAAGASAEQQQQQQQQAGASPQQHQQQGAAPPAQQAQRKADEWCGSGGSSRQLDPGAPGGEERQPVTARAGAAQAGFWRTLGNMLGDIAIVASGPERQALQVGGGGCQVPARTGVLDEPWAGSKAAVVWLWGLHRGRRCTESHGGAATMPVGRSRHVVGAHQSAHASLCSANLLPPLHPAPKMALWLAFFNQAFASTSIINYAPQASGRQGSSSALSDWQQASGLTAFPRSSRAPAAPAALQVLERAGVESHSAAALLSSAVGGSKVGGAGVRCRGRCLLSRLLARPSPARLLTCLLQREGGRVPR